MAVPSSLFQWNSSWSMLFLPWVVWSMMPPWQDITLLTTFVISQVLLYSMQHMRGTLILSTLVLLLWTKSLLSRWYRTQTLTREFFKRLLYMVLTILASLAAVLLVWMPLYEAYACVVSKLDRATAKQAMDWRNTIFLIAAICLAISSIAQTDLVLKPSQMDNAGLTWMMRKVTLFIYRCLRYVLRDAVAILRTAERCVHAGYKQRTRRSGSIKRHQDMSDDDATDDCTQELRKQNDSSQSTTTRFCRQTQRPVAKRNGRHMRSVSFTDVSDDSYSGPHSNRPWLRSSDKHITVEHSASDIEPEPFRNPSHSAGRVRKPRGVHPLYPSRKSHVLSKESSSDLVSAPLKKPGRPPTKAKLHASFHSQQPLKSPKPSVSYSYSVRGSGSKRCLTESTSDESSMTKRLQQCVTPRCVESPSRLSTMSRMSQPRSSLRRQARSPVLATSYLLQKSINPTQETSPIVDTTSTAHLLQTDSTPKQETSSCINAVSQHQQHIASPVRELSSVVDTTSQLLQQSVIPTTSSVSAPIITHLAQRRAAHLSRISPVVHTTSHLLQQSVLPSHENPSVAVLPPNPLQPVTPASETSVVGDQTIANLSFRSDTPFPGSMSSALSTSILLQNSVKPRLDTPSSVDTEVSLESINIRSENRCSESSSSTLDSLKSNASSQTDSVSTEPTSLLLQRCVKPRRQNPSSVDTASLSMLPSVSMRCAASSTEACSSHSRRSSLSSESFRSSQASTRFKIPSEHLHCSSRCRRQTTSHVRPVSWQYDILEGQVNSSETNSSQMSTVDSVQSDARLQSSSSLNLTLSAMLHGCVVPSSTPVTRSQTRQNQETEGKQMTKPNARKSKRAQADDSLEKSRVTRASKRCSQKHDQSSGKW